MNIDIDQVWLDQDKRRSGRSFKVLDLVDRADGKYAKVDDGKRKTLIRVDRFKNKYYKLKSTKPELTAYQKNVLDVVNSTKVLKLPTKAPVENKNKLSERCKKFIGGTWGGFKNVAISQSGLLNVLVREVKADCYDIKLRVDGHLIYSKVFRKDLRETLTTLKSYLTKLSNNTTDLLSIKNNAVSQYQYFLTSW